MSDADVLIELARFCGPPKGIALPGLYGSSQARKKIAGNTGAPGSQVQGRTDGGGSQRLLVVESAPDQAGVADDRVAERVCQRKHDVLVIVGLPGVISGIRAGA